jgi:hydroxymethylbilane synthase
LAVTVRSDDETVAALVRQAVHEPGVAIAVAAERAFLRRLEGGCQVPVAAYAEPTREGRKASLRLHGRVVSLDGEIMIEGMELGTAGDEEAAMALGSALAERLLAEGAGSILMDARAASLPTVPEP